MGSADPASVARLVGATADQVLAGLPGRPMLRVGVDVQAVSSVREAVDRFGPRYLDRVFRPGEVSDSGYPWAPPEAVAERLAGRFAAKEAALKALRPADDPPGFRDIEIIVDQAGAPMLSLHDRAQRLALTGHWSVQAVSFGHDDGLAVAIVVFCAADAGDQAGLRT